jgi:hypothetical protein
VPDTAGVQTTDAPRRSGSGTAAIWSPSAVCHDRAMDLVERSVHIAAPVARVRSQFGDVAHHQNASVHRGVTFDVVADDGIVCRYRQVTRTGPFRSTQELELRRDSDGPLVNSIVRGPFRGGAIVFDITADGADRTAVTARLASDRSRHRALRPLLSLVVGRALSRALEEDRIELEAGRYPTAAKP